MKLTEIARSFSYKLNIGNYQSADFFCSQKLEVPFEEAEETSRALFHFCKMMVMKEVNEYIKANTDKEVIDIKDLFPKEDLFELPNGQGTFPKSRKQKQDKEFWRKEEMADIEQSNKKGD